MATTAAAVQRMDGGDMMEEDEYAHMLGQFAMTLASCRLRRTLRISHGWPVQFYKVGLVPELAEETMKKFKEDLDLFRVLKAMVGKPKALQAVADRHVFNKVSNIQLIKGCEAENWIPSPKLEKVCKSRCRLYIQTQVAEGCIGTMKNNAANPQQAKFKKPETSMASVLRTQVLSNRHKHQAVPCDLALDKKIARLTGDCFRAEPKTRPGGRQGP